MNSIIECVVSGTRISISRHVSSHGYWCSVDTLFVEIATLLSLLNFSDNFVGKLNVETYLS
jgi:hypothetical protein